MTLSWNLLHGFCVFLLIHVIPDSFLISPFLSHHLHLKSSVPPARFPKCCPNICKAVRDAEIFRIFCRIGTSTKASRGALTMFTRQYEVSTWATKFICASIWCSERKSRSGNIALSRRPRNVRKWFSASRTVGGIFEEEMLIGYWMNANLLVLHSVSFMGLSGCLVLGDSPLSEPMNQILWEVCLL